MSNRTELTESRVEKALECYVEQRMKLQEFAELLDLSLGAASHILQGRTWTQVKRPPNLQYPWPEHPTNRRHLTTEKVEEGLRLYILHGWTAEKLAEFLDTKSMHHLKSIFDGYLFKEAVRPKELIWRTETDAFAEKLRVGLELYAGHGDVNKLSEFIGKNLDQTLRIIEGRTYTHVPRPEGLQDIKKVLVPNKDVHQIIELTCQVFNVSSDNLMSHSRAALIALPRHVAMYLARKHLDLSFPELGIQFGRDHSTIQHACASVEDKMRSSNSLFAKIQILDELVKEKIGSLLTANSPSAIL